MQKEMAMLNIEEMYYRIETAEGKLALKEQVQLRQLLLQPDAHRFHYNTKALLTFVMGTSATTENVKLVERFLKSDVNDSIREAAIECLTFIWEIKEKYDDIIQTNSAGR